MLLTNIVHLRSVTYGKLTMNVMIYMIYAMQTYCTFLTLESKCSKNPLFTPYPNSGMLWMQQNTNKIRPPSEYLLKINCLMNLTSCKNNLSNGPGFVSGNHYIFAICCKSITSTSYCRYCSSPPPPPCTWGLVTMSHPNTSFM